MPVLPVVTKGVVCLEPTIRQSEHMPGYFVEFEFRRAPELTVKRDESGVEFFLGECWLKRIFVIVHEALVSNSELGWRELEGKNCRLAFQAELEQGVIMGSEWLCMPERGR